MMSEKEHKEFRDILRKQRGEVTSSKEAARKFLTVHGFLDAKGKLKKKYRSEP